MAVGKTMVHKASSQALNFTITPITPSFPLPHPAPLAPFPATPEQIRILVGPEQRTFHVDKQLLCNAAPFFQEQLSIKCDATNSVPISSLHRNQTKEHHRRHQHESKPAKTLWLPAESPAMFDLFLLWLVQGGAAFRANLDTTLATASEGGPAVAQRLQWSLVRVHLFAAQLSLAALQDAAMDALQDLYLKCDWDVTPRFVRFLYGQCEAVPAVRLRKWAVAMVAWLLAGGGSAASAAVDQHRLPPVLEDGQDGEEGGQEGLHGLGIFVGPSRSQFQDLFDKYPEFAADYAVHVSKMASSKLSARLKNPQLRIQANRLRSEGRQFGFRQCSFHSHRRSVGEKRCPHSVVGTEGEDGGMDEAAARKRERDERRQQRRLLKELERQLEASTRQKEQEVVDMEVELPVMLEKSERVTSGEMSERSWLADEEEEEVEGWRLSIKQERRRQVVINTMFPQDVPPPLRRMNSSRA